MSIQKLDSWAAKSVQTFPLSILKDAVIGVDATYYLELRLNETRDEPLKQATGGLPYTLEATVEQDINAACDAGVTLLFVFNGLDFVNKAAPDFVSSSSIRAHENAWKQYIDGDEEASATQFGRARYPLGVAYRYLQKILQARKVTYLVAPYSAVAQLSYLFKSPEPQIDGVICSTDAFLFDIDKVILNWNTQQSSFDWLSKTACEERLGRVSASLFRDAQLLLGSVFLPTFPILERAHTSKSSIADALNLLNGAAKSVLQLCNQYREDPVVQGLDYADRYKKAVMTIRHHIIIERNGVVAPLDFEHAPGDVHEFVGQRLPEELFFYISKGLLGAEIPNWLTSGIINLSLPGGVADSDAYKRLVIEQLNPLRTQALKLVAESLNYYYSNREVNLKTWDSRDTSSLKIELKGSTSLKFKASEWKVKSAVLPHTKLGQAPSLLLCLQSVKDKNFAQKTITKARLEHPALASQDEIVSNVFWRFLQVRGYIDDKHELTSLGLMLEATLASLEGSDVNEELGVVAVEMLRLGLFNAVPVSASPAPVHDKNLKSTAHTILISKIACLGHLEQDEKGYAGPIDRQLLSFAWMITAVRSSLRNLIESVLVGMFLNGDASRARQDWTQLPQRLPFIVDNGSALGIATKLYLDLVTNDADDTFKTKVKNQEDEKHNYFPQVKDKSLTKSLNSAFALVDAIYAGTKAAGKDGRDGRSLVDASKVLAEAETWLTPRR